MNSLGDASLIFLMGLGTNVLIGPSAIRLLRRAQCLSPSRYEDCPPLQPYQQRKQGTPSMGGLFVLGVGSAVAALAGGLASREGWLVLGAVVALGAVGLLDDCLKLRGPNGVGLRSLPKLLAALAVGAFIGWASRGAPQAYSLVHVPWAPGAVDLRWAWVPFTMLVLAGSAHAVNLTDGMDGLAAGCVAIALALLGVWALQGDATTQTLVPWCAALAGASVGFLWFNSFPASVFLGDVGALGLGAALGSLSLFTHTSLWLLVIGGIFVIEALSVMLQVASYRWRGKRRIFRVAPIHHHFHLGGITEPKLIVRFWIAGLTLALLGLAGLGNPARAHRAAVLAAPNGAAGSAERIGSFSTHVSRYEMPERRQP